MAAPIYYDSEFPYLCLSLDDVGAEDIAMIPHWIEHLHQVPTHKYYRLDLHSHHPFLAEIISVLVHCIPNDPKLTYVRIKSTHKKNYLTDSLLDALMRSIYQNRHDQGIIVEFCPKSRRSRESHPTLKIENNE